MRKNKKYLRGFLWISVIIFLIGLIGRFIPYGYASWNFFFENLIFFPIELLITVFVIEKLLETIAENNKAKREFTDYYLLAKDEIKEVRNSLKSKMVYAHTGVATISNKKVADDFVNLSQNLDKIINAEIVKEGLIITSGEWIDGKFEFVHKNVNIFKHLSNQMNDILEMLRDHISMYSKIIPIDIHNELIIIIRYLEKNMLYSDKKIGQISHEHIHGFYEHNSLNEDEYEQFAELVKIFFREYEQHLLKLDNFFDENFKMIVNK